RLSRRLPATVSFDVPRAASLPSQIGLYGAAHALGLLAPLLTTPWLARALGPAAWGPVLVAQGLAGLLTLLVEFGFDLTATRDVARLHDRRAHDDDRPARDGAGASDAPDPVALAALVGGVTGARALMIPVAALLTLGAIAAVPALRAHPLLAWLAWGTAAARGLTPLWYFQGAERPAAAVGLDTTMKLLAAVAVLPLVRGPEDAARAVALPALAAALVSTLLFWRVHRDLDRRGATIRLSRAAALGQLAAARDVFLFRGAAALYQHANLLLIGALGSPAAVAAYGGADRIVRAAVNTLQPLTLAFFPRNSRAASAPDRDAFSQTVRWIVGAGAAWTLLLLLGAPALVTLLLGPGYDDVVPTLRRLAALPALIAVGTVLGIHWAIPSGREAPFRRIVVVAGALNLSLGALLIPRWGAAGMTTAVVLAELLVAVALLRLWRRARGGVG
ncbi:MAG: lipopolysaccharide biosynthesis protein, partial [Gemmatimonadota bacterium]|nr:lipopolysaccharide biosynthesis protein [Gemmatimonadota bacterium]MDQ8147960.1 lipopolysaccharide biosynthesis protein [Gemmatimonadota bacterium]MDQ8177299.1 lipopolysaccharide biosynthesis protein [Gemmatimonadota bacterium]